jgi:hypothetical protein
MKQSAPIVTLAGLMAILSSGSSFLFVPKYYGPEIIPSEKPATIVFINNFDYSNQSRVTEKNLERCN